MKAHGICLGLAMLAIAPAGCVAESGTPDLGLADVSQAAAVGSATWGNPVVLDGSYGPDCRPTGVVDRGSFAGEHYFEFYGDFRCGHSESFPTPIYSWQCSLNGSSATARTAYTGTNQVNSAFTLPFEPYARCFVSISSWNQGAGQYEIIL